MQPWLARRWYDSVFWSSFLSFTFGHSLRVIGRRNMPPTGPVLVLANHQSFFDPVLVGLASRRYLSYLARASLFKNQFFRGLIESLDAVPIDNQGLGKDGLQATLACLERGKSVLIFPEGERTSDGNMEPFKAGISLLIKRARTPIVPVGIAGAFHAWPRKQKVPHFAPLFLPAWEGTIALSVGRPIDSGSLAKLDRETMLKQLYNAVHTEWEKAKELRRRKK